MGTLHVDAGFFNLLRLGVLACVAAMAACSPKSDNVSVASGPDAVLGTWVPDAAPQRLLAVDGSPAPLTPEAARVHAERLQRLQSGDSSFDQTTWCAGPGMPRVMTMPYPFEIRRDGDYLAFIHGWYRWHRIVDLAGGAVDDPPLPLTMGFPVGHWEGDTLVIRTIGLSDATALDATGLPHSDQLVLTERLRVLSDGRLEDRLTIEDPDTYTAPWETVLYFHRDSAAHVVDDICPDRIADGEPAVRTALPAPLANAQPAIEIPAVTTDSAATATPRLSGMWEPKTFGFMVPEAPLSTAGRALVDRGAAAMAAGQIMHTAWTSCRPGAVSTMTMPREKILVLQSADEAHDPIRDAAHGAACSVGRRASRKPAAELRRRFRRSLGRQHAGDRYHWIQRLRRARRARATDQREAAHRRATDALARQQQHRYRGDDHRPRSTTTPHSRSSAVGRRAPRGTRSSTTAWRTRGKKTSRTRTTCANAIARLACAWKAKGWRSRKWSAIVRKSRTSNLIHVRATEQTHEKN